MLRSFGFVQAARWTAVLVVALPVMPALGGDPVLEDNFNNNAIDTTLWTVIDDGGDDVDLAETNGRLEISSANDTGQAGIFTHDVALSTASDFRLTFDFNLPVANYGGLIAIGVNLALFTNADPIEGEVGDRVEVGLFRQGLVYLRHWFLFNDGMSIDDQALAFGFNSGTLYVFFDASEDRLWMSATGFPPQIDALFIDDVVADTGADRFQIYLGGFVNGFAATVDGDNLYIDDFVVLEGTLVDATDTPPPALDARDDAAWFRRGDEAGDRLGWAVRFAGDIDGDGINDVVVGAPRDDTAGAAAGRVMVLSGDDGALIFEVLGDSAGDQLGFAVDGAGDWNGDGTPDVVIGAPRADSGGTPNVGAVYVYSGEAPYGLLMTWLGENQGDQLGYSVAGAGDIDDDGFDDILAGAPFNDQEGNNAGRGYAFSGDDGSLLYTKTGQAAGDQFARVLAGIGDIDNDGAADFIFSAPLNDQNGASSGKVSVYSGATGERVHAYIGDAAGDRLGWSAAGIGDVNGDGRDDFILGAINHDEGATDSGAAFVFSGINGNLLYELNGESQGDKYGWVVAASRDLDGDSRPEVIVSSPRRDVGGNNTGRIYIHSGTNGSLLATIDGESGGNTFGTDLDGDTRASMNAFVSVVGGAWRFSSAGRARRGTMYRYELE